MSGAKSNAHANGPAAVAIYRDMDANERADTFNTHA